MTGHGPRRSVIYDETSELFAELYETAAQRAVMDSQYQRWGQAERWLTLLFALHSVGRDVLFERVEEDA